MKEHIEREAAILALLDKGQRSKRYHLSDVWELNFDEIKEAIASIPAASVRPVVLCKDCNWWTKQDSSLQGRCSRLGIYPTGYWFCANGQRKREAEP